jgi:hypothetical protein
MTRIRWSPRARAAARTAQLINKRASKTMPSAAMLAKLT